VAKLELQRGGELYEEQGLGGSVVAEEEERRLGRECGLEGVVADDADWPEE